MINVLYIDDEENNLLSFNANFRRFFNIYTTNSADEARIILSTHTIHVLVTDQQMPGTKGTQLLAESVKNYPNLVRILLTAYADLEAIISAINEGQIFKYLQKPINEKLIKEAIEEAYEKYRTLDNLNKIIAEFKENQRMVNSEIDGTMKLKIGVSKKRETE